MDTFFDFLLYNAGLATVLALGVALLSRMSLRPVILHMLWGLVLVRLIVPPILNWPVTVHREVAAKQSVMPEPLERPGVPAEDSLPEMPLVIDAPAPTTSSSVDSRKTTVAGSKPVANSDLKAEPLLAASDQEKRKDPRSHSSYQNSPVSNEQGTEAKTPTPSIAGWIRAGWISGIAAWLLLAVWRIGRIRQTLQLAQPAPESIRTLTNSLAATLNLRRSPQLKILPGVISPMVWPLGKTSIVLPERLIQELSRDELSMVIGHELVHLRRRDHWMRYLEMLATGLFWWLPTVWWVRSQLHQAEEQCCDAWVAHTWPERIADYSRALLKTATWLSSRQTVLPACGLGTFRSLQRRLAVLAGSLPSHRLSLRSKGIVIALAALVLGNSCYVQVREVFATERTKATVTRPEIIDHLEAPVSPDKLPVRFDPISRRLSPDGTKLAIVGRWNSAEKRYGLFVIDLTTGDVFHLVKKPLKTPVAWSPDSQRIAFANAGGYVVRYPLAIVDVASGNIEETGILGHDPDWSPDGSRIACIVDRTRGDGVPDGRVGVWDLETQSLRTISPPGFDVRLRNGDHFVSGALRPAWSPDGRQIAYLQAHREAAAEQIVTRCDLWVIDADGDNLRLVQRDVGYAGPQWSTDSRALVVGSTKEKRDVTQLAPAPRTDWPALPPVAQRGLEEQESARKRAAQFDVARVLRVNQPWQKPDYSRLKSLEFTHRMSPIRLDERFSWQRNGPWSVEVLNRDEEQSQPEIGKLWLMTPNNDVFILLADDAYPRKTELKPHEVVRSRFGHLMGTKINFVSLDWGRNPALFDVVDARPGKEPGQTVLELQLNPQVSRRYRINYGTMFHFTSWAYLHDLAVRRAELTIDEQTGRILSETAFTNYGLTQITLAEWIERGGKSFPGFIHITNEHEQYPFDAEYRFQLLPEGVWLLKSGQSQFAGKEAQREEIVDLKIDAETPEVQQHLNRIRAGQAGFEQPDQTVGVQFESNRFQLGQREELTWSNDDPAGRLTSVEFVPRLSSERFREMHAHPTLRARFHYQQPFPEIKTADPLLFVLYDEAGQPIHVYAIPISAVDALHRPAAEFLNRIRRHSRLWLDPDLTSLPQVTYTFHRNKTQQADYTVQHPDNVHFQRGVTMTTALDAFVREPEKYRMPVHFTAKWNGRAVEVAVITGSDFGWVYGNGIENGWTGGYIVSKRSMATLIIDRATGQPLLESYGDRQVHFQDYAEPESGQFVPRRIVLQQPSWKLDFRFQVADGKVWLLDRTVTKNPDVAVWVDNIRFNEQPPQKILRATEPEDAPIEPFDWESVTDRAVPETGVLFDRTMAEFVNFETHPQFQLLARLELPRPGELEFDLGSSTFLKFAHSWTLSRTTSDGIAIGQTASRIAKTAQAIRFNDGVRQVVKAVAPDSKTRLQSVEPHFAGGAARANLELVSQDHYTGHSTLVSGVLFNSAGLPVSAAELSSTYRVMVPIYQTDSLEINFGEIPGAASQKLLGSFGIQTRVVSAPVGSTWGRMSSREPVLPIAVLLANPNPEVWTMGLVEIYSDHDIRRTGKRRDRDYRRRVGQQLAPYRDAFHKHIETGRDKDGLALLCRLAGQTEDRSFVPQLVPLLQHEEKVVRDSAAVGLGFLQDDRASRQIQQLAASPPDEIPDSIGYLNLINDAKNALDVLGNPVEPR